MQHSLFVQVLDHLGTKLLSESALVTSFLHARQTTPYDMINFRADSFFHCIGLLKFWCCLLQRKQITGEMVSDGVSAEAFERRLLLRSSVIMLQNDLMYLFLYSLCCYDIYIFILPDDLVTELYPII